MMNMGAERQDIRLAIIVTVFVYGWGLFYFATLWTLAPDGLSATTGSTPYWDFSNLWSAGRLILDGHIDWLFEPDHYRAWLRLTFSEALPNQEWSYPPNLFFLAVPLGALPIMPAYLLWTFGTILCLHFAIRPLALPPFAHWLAITGPAVWMNAAFGQNGALTAALLLGGLLNLERRPILAGVLIGFMAIKPHLALLVPFCVLASRNWKAFLSAALTVVGLNLATGLVFGFDVWRNFFGVTAPLMSAILEAPFPQSYHGNAATAFIMGRWLGFDLAGAYALQAAFALAAIIACVVMWRPASTMPVAKRAVLTAVLAIVSTPYGYSYDMVPLGVAVAWLAMHDKGMNRLGLVPIWIAPLFIHALIIKGGVAIGVLFPATLAIWALWRDWSGKMTASRSEP